ncbi:Thioredoxin reductase [Caldicoprobacter faecalis]|uniref:Thioredoxin reductase n=2 Tax=Caldicoprobacter faecalis TaxID=937334 RepID=A0A1I5TAC6_9FIRM|nr:Thioredoxin reductase [Caldicoprobacter faecalis]
MLSMKADVVVIGGGPAGLAAALSCHRYGIRDIIILERDSHLGGILQQCIHNGFGLHWFGEELTGPEYAQRFIDQVEKAQIPYLLDTMVVDIDEDKRVYAVNPKHGPIEIQARAVILAMGCRERTRGALMIPGGRPAGVYTAGMAQRLINIEGYMPGREVVILGSGDIGLIMARRLTWEGANVKMVCEIMPYSTGLIRNIRQCLEDYGIPIRFKHTVIKIHGRERLEGVTVAQVDDARRPIPGTEEYVPCDTLLLSVGLIPENELSQKANVQLDPVTGGPVVDEYRQTSVPGIFACGNVLHVHDLVDYVSEEAEIAGYGVWRYLNGLASQYGQHVDRRVKIETGYGIRYVVPQRILGEEDVELFFRSDNIYNDGVVELTDGQRLLASKKFLRIVPGQMERFKIKKQALSGIKPGGRLLIRWRNLA